MTTNRSMWPRCAATVAILAGATFAADYDPTGQAGQYQQMRAAELIKGSGGSFAPSTVYAPFFELGERGLLNAAVIEVVNGRAFAATSVFGTEPGTLRQTVALSPIDSGSPLVTGASVNQLIVELATNEFSNSLGAMLPDGTLTIYERFSTVPVIGPFTQAQNNIGYWNAVQGAASGAAIRQAPNKVIVNTQPNVGNAAETNLNAVTATIKGSVFIGTPSATRDPNMMPGGDEDLITVNTHFNGFSGFTVPGATEFASAINGVAAYRGPNNPSTSGLPGVQAGTFNPAGHVATWLQSAVPLPTVPAGESRANTRQTQPVVAAVNTPAGGSLVYVAHGIGFSTPSPIGGGSARPVYLAVDAITNGAGGPRMDYVGSNPLLDENTILIEADAAGGEGTQHGAPYDAVAPLTPGYADHFNTDINKKFVDKQATGGGTGPSTNSQFDMNSKGQIAALWVDEGLPIRRYEVRVYDPIWNGAGTRIQGYTLGKVVAFNGDLDNSNNPYIVEELVTAAETGPGVFQTVRVVPISGVSIDDEGRVAFTAVTEVVKSVMWDSDPMDPFNELLPYLLATQTALFIWEPTTDTLHRLLIGGEGTGVDVLADGFAGDGDPGEGDLILGFFPTDVQSDGFNRESLSRSGGWIAVPFRSSGTVYTGGVPTNFGTFPDDSPIPTAVPTATSTPAALSTTPSPSTSSATTRRASAAS